MKKPNETTKDAARRRVSQLETERQEFLPWWRDLADHTVPQRYRYNITQNDRGKIGGNKIINNRGTQDLRTLASGMMAGVTSPARPWFKLSTPDPMINDSHRVRLWLSAVQERMQEAFSKSNLYNVLPSVYMDLAQFGTASMGEVEDPENIFWFTTDPIGSYAVASSRRRMVDTWTNTLPWTVEQVVTEFGLANVCETTRRMWNDGQLSKEIQVTHLIMPNEGRDMTKMDAANKPYLSLWWEQGADDTRFLRKSGYDEFPYFVPRWEIVGNDSWGTGCPGMHALQDVRGLQLEERRKLEAIEKHVNPPMVADPSLRKRRKSLLPGGVTYAASQNGNRPGMAPVHEVQPNIEGVMNDIMRTEQRISSTYFADLFLMVSMADNKDMTAREIQERHEEKLLMLGPVLERIHTELLDQLIERSFNIMMRNGHLPEPPEEIQGVDLKVEYVSMLAQAQQMVGSAVNERFIGYVGNLAQFDPEALDKISIDDAIDVHGEDLGADPRIIRSQEKVEEIRAKRREEQRRQQLMEQAQQGAETAEKLSNADMAGDNGLNRLIQGLT